MSKLNSFINYAFLGRKDDKDSAIDIGNTPQAKADEPSDIDRDNDNDVFDINELSLSEDEKTKGKNVSKHSKKKSTSNHSLVERVILNANCLIGFICAASFLAILVYAFFKADEKIPEVITTAFSVTLGYIGGVYVTFIKNNS
jgi:hypothetical protein